MTSRKCPRYVVGGREGEKRLDGLRYFVVGARDPQFLHATSQGVGVQVEDLGRALRPFDHPSCLFQHRQDMALFDRFERQSIFGNRACSWTPRLAALAGREGRTTHALGEP